MSKDEAVIDKALSKDENGLQPKSRPKSGSLSSDDGDNLNPKQSRFFKNLSRSLDPASVPPKKDFLDEYQKYKAKQALKLHGVVKQQTIDLGTLESTSNKSAENRRCSTGTNPQLSLQTDVKTKTLPASHSSRGPPPPVAPRKKSVNLPPIDEPAGRAPTHTQETSSYILSAAKKEQHKTDLSFQKFRSLTGPTVFRPAKNGPTNATRKITPVGLGITNSEKEEATVNNTGSTTGAEDNGQVNETVPEVEQLQEDPIKNPLSEESVGELNNEEKDAATTDTNKDDGTQETVGSESSSVIEVEQTKEASQEEEVSANVAVQNELKEASPSQEDKEVIVSSSEDKKSVTEEDKDVQVDVEMQADAEIPPSEPVQVAEDKQVNLRSEVEETIETNESKESLIQTKEGVNETKDGMQENDSKIEDGMSSTDKQEDETTVGGEEDGQEALQNQQSSIADSSNDNEVVVPEIKTEMVDPMSVSDAKLQETSENKGDSSKDAQQNQQSTAVEGTIQEVVPGTETANCVPASDSQSVSENAADSLVEVQSQQSSNAVENGDESVDKVVDNSEKAVESQVDDRLTADCQKEENKDEQEVVSLVKDNEKVESADSTEKLSKMADLLISFSEDKKEKLTANDGDLDDVGKELQKLNSCIEEISGVNKQEEKSEDAEKLENLETMRKEMEEMVTEFDTYL